MATKNENSVEVENLTTRPRIYLPMLEEQGGVKVDQYEHVTVNGNTTLIRRGEYVDVTPEVYIQLKNRFPNI